MMNRIAKILLTFSACALLAVLTAGCREGQKTNPLSRASFSGTSATEGDGPARPNVTTIIEKNGP